MRYYWFGLIVFVTFTVPVDRSYGQEEFPPTVDQLGIQLLLEPIMLDAVNPKPFRIDDLFQPLYKTYFILEKLDVIILDAVDYYLKEPEPQSATPYRTHGSVI